MKNNDPVGYHRKTVESDVEYIAERLRDADRQEIEALLPGWSMERALMDSFHASAPCHTMVRTFERDHQPVGLFGVSPSEPHSRVGLVWLMGTDDLVDCRIVCSKFLRGCRKVLPLINETYPVLTNIVDSRNKAHLRFLEWLGFEVFPESLKVSGVKFYRFRMIHDSIKTEDE